MNKVKYYIDLAVNNLEEAELNLKSAYLNNGKENIKEYVDIIEELKNKISLLSTELLINDYNKFQKGAEKARLNSGRSNYLFKNVKLEKFLKDKEE